MSPSTSAVGNVIARGGESAQAMSQQSSAGQPSVFDVWSYSYDGMSERMSSASHDPASFLADDPSQLASAAAAAMNMSPASANQIANSMSAQASTLGESVDAIHQAHGALQTVGATFALLTSVEQMLSTLLSAIPFPALPAVRIADFDIGLPHAHMHPPNLIPPATVPVPLPSMGPVIPIPILSGAIHTLINNMPAARCGDMGLGIWCGGYFPMYEVFLGSSSVWIESMRAARMLVDITQHCTFTVPKPNDPPLGPMIGTTISASPNVLIGGIPMPSLTAMAIGAAMKGLFKLAGKGAKAFGRLTAPLLRRLAKNLDNEFVKCKILRAEPVNFVTGEVAVEQQDYEIPARIPIAWSRQYGSHSSRKGACGYGWSTPADARLVLEQDGAVLFYDGRGAAKIFPYLLSHGTVQEFVGGARLEAVDDRLRVCLKNGLAYVFPRPAAHSPQTEILVQQVEDRCGNFVRYSRDESGLLQILESTGRRIEIKSERGLIREMWLKSFEHDAAHLLVRYEYSEAGELLAVYDALGNPYRFRYEHRRLVQHTDRTGLSFYYAYDSDQPSARCHQAWGDGGLYHYGFEFDPIARRVMVKNSLGAISTIQLNELNLPLWEIDPLGGMTKYEYDDRGRTIGVTDPGGRRVGYEYDDRGNLLKLTRPDGKNIEVTFNADDKLRTITNPSGACWEQEWDARGLLRAQISPLGHVSRYEYDRFGQPTAYTNPLGARTEFSYDRIGNLTCLKDALGHDTRFGYDARGNLIDRLDALGRRTLYGYDPKNRLIEMRLPSGASRHCTYDAEDNLIRFVDENGAQTRFEYCGLGEIARRIQPDGRSVQYDYDTEEQIVGITNQRGDRYQLKRDALGQIVEEIDYWGKATTYRLDGSGYLQQTRDPLGRITDFTTDELGRVRSKRFAHPLITGRIFEETFEYDANSNLIACANEHVKVQRRFDAEGRLLEERQGDFVVRNLFDSLGRRIQRETSIGNSVAHEYNKLGLPTAIGINNEAPMTLEHDAVGRLLKETLGPSLERHYRYDAEGRLTAQGVRRETRWLFHTQYDYDQAGNLVQRQDSHTGTDLYRYDPLGHVFEHIDPQGKIERFLHDSAGDRLTTTVREEGSWCREGWCDGVHYHFDAAGNLVERRDERRHEGVEPQTLALEWDANQRLVRSRAQATFGGSEAGGVETVYGYDPLGRRVFKRTGDHTTWFGWDGDALVADVLSTEDGSVATREWVYFPDSFEPLALIQGAPGAEEVLHYHNDVNGCPMRLTDSGGKILWWASHTPWGEISRLHVRAVDQPLGLQGQYRDNETDTYYNLHRYYDPKIGAFLSIDPLGLRAGTALYCFGPNALGWVDPLGLTCTSATLVDGRYEYFYRAMSKSDYEHFLTTGRLRATTETFMSPTRKFSEAYKGVLVRFQVARGTEDELRAIGVRAHGSKSAAALPDLPEVKRRWGKSKALFKPEGNQVNIGLGKGKALDVFNDSIRGFEVLGVN